MGQLKDRMLDSMNGHEMQEYLTKYRSDHDIGYIQFLEEQLEKTEKKVHTYKMLLKAEKGPGYCVECFKPLGFNEIICSKCQDECDGRWDHLKENNNNKESQE